jgi:hypothetical protein
VFAHVCLIVGALLAEFTLPNGIRVVELPPQVDSFEIVAGYEVENSALSSAVSSFLLSTKPVRTMAVAAYGAGGQVEAISESSRIGIRITGPAWAKPLIDEQLPAFFAQTADTSPELIARAAAIASDADRPDFRTEVEDDLRAALLGFRLHPERIPASDLAQFFRENMGADRAFVVTTGVVNRAIEQVPARSSVRTQRARPTDTPAERVMRYSPGLPDGAVILASPVPSVYYDGWYAILLLDRFIRRTLPAVSSSGLAPSLEASYIRLEVTFPEGQFDDIVEAGLIESLERVQLTQPDPADLEAARASAIEYLQSESVQRWFQSLGIERRRVDGIELLKSLSSDQVRAAARDLVADRVTASWSPKPKQVTVEVEDLNAAAPRSTRGSLRGSAISATHRCTRRVFAAAAAGIQRERSLQFNARYLCRAGRPQEV